MENSTWKKHCNLYEENVYYIRNDIQKPFNMGILECSEHMRNIYEISNLLPLRIRNNEWYHEDAWYTRYTTYKEEIISKANKEGLSKEM